MAFADYGDMAAEAAVASSTGITATARRTVASVAVETIAGADADSQTGVGFSAARGPGDLDLDKAVADAVERSTRMLGATKARSGRCAVILDPRVTSTLLAVVSSALSGEAVTKGRSFFADRVGEEVAVPSLVLVDDPTDARSFGASTHDAEGLACRRNVLIENGVLRGFVFDTTAARRAGVASTASAVRGGYATTPVAGCRALLLSPGSTRDRPRSCPRSGEALFVQSITGVHSGVNPVSGDFSVGAEGLMVRGGVLAEPVREVTIASTLQRMLQSVLHIGSDVEWLPGVAAGQTAGHRRDGAERLVERRPCARPPAESGRAAALAEALGSGRGRSGRRRGPGLRRRPTPRSPTDFDPEESDDAVPPCPTRRRPWCPISPTCRTCPAFSDAVRTSWPTSDCRSCRTRCP